MIKNNNNNASRGSGIAEIKINEEKKGGKNLLLPVSNDICGQLIGTRGG